MAQSNWSGFGHVGSVNGRNERPMMNLRQSEGERLHEQALSFYVHGNLAQAKILLEKAVALEPSNESFQETRNYFTQVEQWPSSYRDQQQVPGRSYPDAEPQWAQFERNPATPVNSTRQHWGSEGVHSSSNVSNGNLFKPRSARGQWQQPANGTSTQYFSNTVADSMFGPAYWAHPEGVQNHGENRTHFGEPQPPQRQNNVSYAGKTNFGSHYGKPTDAHMYNTSTQDNTWGQWNDTGAVSDPKPETAWADSGYRQSDVPWTDEPRKAASLPNYNRSGANGSVSQSSQRGSMANSTERFSLKEHPGRARQSSPHTWRSEETSSETNYGLDNFDEVSNKVQEWLVRNESSGVQKPPPPGLGKPKKNKKKKKKKMEAAPQHESQGTAPQTKKDASQSKRGQTSSPKEQLLTSGSKNPVRTMSASVESSCQKDETKNPSRSVPYCSQSSKPRTVPSTANSATNSNSDKPSKHSSPNPNGSKGCTESYPFFDPKRIFDSSNSYKDFKPSGNSNQKDSSAKENSSKRSEREDGIFNRKLSSNESRGGGSAKTTGEKRSDATDVKITDGVDCNSSQVIEADSMTEDADKSWLNSSGSVSSDVSGRMTREEWEDIIKRMYVPLGVPSNISQGNPEPAEETKTSAKQTSFVQNCNENSVTASDTDTFKGSPVSQWETGPDRGTSSLKKEPKAGSTNAAEKDHRGPRRAEYVDVKASLDAGILENRIPVCHAGTGIKWTAPADKRIRFFGKDKCLSTQTTQSTQAIPSSLKPVSKGPSTSTKRGNTSPELGSNVSTKPVQEPKVEASAAPSEKSRNEASRGLHVISSESTGKGTTEPAKEPKVEVSSAASLKSSNAAVGGIGVKAKHPEASKIKGSERETPAKVQPTQPSKPFWEPARIFATPPKKDQDSRKKQSGAGASCAESNNKLRNVTSSVQQTAKLKDTTSSGSEDALKACDTNATSNGGMTSQPVTRTKKSTSAERASTSNSDCKSPTLKSNDSLNSASNSQTGDPPLKSSTKYSYVAWRDQKAEKDKCTSTKTSQASPAQASQNKSFPSAESKRSGQTEAQPAPKPAARPTKVSTSQDKSEDPGLRSDAASSKVPFENGPAKETSEKTQSQFSSSSKHPQPTQDAASTRPQDRFNSRNVPVNNSPREDFSKTRTNSSNKVPSAKPDPKARESSKPHPGESKTRSASGTAPNSHQHQQKRAEASTAYASHPGRPSTDSGSKSSRSGTAQGSRQQASSRTSEARTAASAREEDTGPRQRQRAGATSDNLDVEDVDPWYKWTRAIGKGLWWTLCFIVFLLLILLACLYSTLKVGLKYSWHILKELAKLIQEHRHGKRSPEGSSGGQGSWGSSGTDNRRAPAEPTRSIDIPTSGGEAIKRLMRCNQDNPYEVLGVSSEASEDDIKKYYRRQCMLVHPDKNDHPNAREAFQILQKAYDTLTDPIKRRDFEMESKYTHMNEEMEDFVKKMEEKMEEVLNTLSCDVCNGKHRRYETDRDPHYARFCRRHGTRHPAYEGDVWVETTHLGFKWHFYAMMEDKIFDITEWAKCQDMKYMEANSCEIRYRVGTQRNRNPSRQRTSSPNHHSHHRGQDFNGDVTEDLLRDLLRQFHQGDARGGGAGGASYGGGDSGSQDRGKKGKKHRKKKR
ncbi:uncharacterized protein LOC119737397 [Patiria miniata]|uniref:J domain-containing protein n=1 Tax=Patiria miniata TaxID=46514 RepID=A0A914AUA8_PATMI|nr:uncharacterized protein LOC119737397 [Patiria miniata]